MMATTSRTREHYLYYLYILNLKPKTNEVQITKILAS